MGCVSGVSAGRGVGTKNKGGPGRAGSVECKCMTRPEMCDVRCTMCKGGFKRFECRLYLDSLGTIGCSVGQEVDKVKQKQKQTLHMLLLQARR